MSSIPLVARAADEVITRVGGRDIRVARFCADIACVAQILPNASYVTNLCQDRYTFTVSFFAALLRQQTNLLPARREAQASQALKQRYPDCVVISDQPGAGIDACIDIEAGANGEASSASCPGAHTAALVFTSGSTGEPQVHSKSWRMLDTWRRVHQRYLPGPAEQSRGLVATVPSWHMYGLEWAMLLPTIAPLTLHCGADFYPQDVATALTEFQHSSVLISTPVHLRALRKLTQPPANVDTVMSATAPLDDTLTQQIESMFDAQLFEIYGCSEVGSLAFRYPSRKTAWRFFDCFELCIEGSSLTVNHAALPAAVTLADHFSQTAPDLYELEGRHTDIIKIGGKRESLAHLNNILLAVDGVDDGVVYDPSQYGIDATGRLAALVVAPELDSSTLRKALAQQIDTAFLPRPIRFVAHLPRDNTSKLKHAELSELIHSA